MTSRIDFLRGLRTSSLQLYQELIILNAPVKKTAKTCPVLLSLNTEIEKELF